MTDILAINAHTYPTQLKADIEDESVLTTTVLAVLVAAPVDRYTCRVGIGNPEWVAKYGDKISFGLACAHFPNKDLKRRKYQS